MGGRGASSGRRGKASNAKYNGLALLMKKGTQIII